MSNLVSDACVKFVKEHEGFSSTLYDDGTGVMTLGYGLTGSEIRGRTYISEPEAAAELKNLLNTRYAQPIKNALDNKGVQLNQNQFDALTSMAYNIGTSGLLGSTLFRDICRGVRDVQTITTDFCMWDKPLSQPGLLIRRKAEAAMFFGNNATAPAQAQTSPTGTLAQLRTEALQYDINLSYGTNLVTDGLWGPKTEAATDRICICQGTTNQVVAWVQSVLGITVDGIFGPNTYNALVAYQTKHNLGVDGIIGPETIKNMID